MQRQKSRFSVNKPDSFWICGLFEICKLRHFTVQNRLGCSSYLIQNIKMYPCVKFGAFIRIWTLHHLSTSTIYYIVESYPAKFIYLNFHLLEVVSRYRDPQLQVGENYSYSFNLRNCRCQPWCLNRHFVPNISDLIWKIKQIKKRHSSWSAG